MRVVTVAYNHPGMEYALNRGLVPCEDHFNNVNRRCSLRGDTNGRQWTVETPLRLRSGSTPRYYIVRNWQTGKYRVVLSNMMGDLY